MLQDEEQEIPPAVLQTHARLRQFLLSLVVVSVLCYGVLLVWGFQTWNHDNTSEIRGLPTVRCVRARVRADASCPRPPSDILVGSSSITVFYVIVICLFGHIRTMWAVAHIMNAENPAMVNYLVRTRRCCAKSIGACLFYLTVSIVCFGLLQIVLLLLLAIVPVEAPSEHDDDFAPPHTLVASLMTLASVIHASLLTIRREAVFSVFKQAGKVRTLAGQTPWSLANARFT
jgi:hypothetical protein